MLLEERSADVLVQIVPEVVVDVQNTLVPVLSIRFRVPVCGGGWGGGIDEDIREGDERGPYATACPIVCPLVPSTVQPPSTATEKVIRYRSRPLLGIDQTPSMSGHPVSLPCTQRSTMPPLSTILPENPVHCRAPPGQRRRAIRLGEAESSRTPKPPMQNCRCKKTQPQTTAVKFVQMVLRKSQK